MSSLETAVDPALKLASADLNILRMPDMTFDFRQVKANLPGAVTASRLLCVWATAGTSPENLQQQLPLRTSQRLLHFMVSDSEAHHHVCSSPLNSSDVDTLMQGMFMTRSIQLLQLVL